jgi:hypothetical protein
MQFANLSAFNVFQVSASLVLALLGQPVFAQNEALPDNVSMVSLNTQMSPAGQTVITPKGYVVPVPGAGVDGPVLQVFMGSKGGYWYVDKNGQQVDLTPTVQRLQGNVIQSQPKASAPQYAPPPQTYAAQPTYVQPATNQTNSALTTATAAGLGAMTGAMTGAAMANSSNYNSAWNHVPYGTPIHYGADSKAYYNAGDKPVYVNNATKDEAMAYHPETSMQQQQNWYKEQQAKQTSAYKNWQKPTSNPFVADGQQAAHYGAANGQEMNKYHADGGQANGQEMNKYHADGGQANGQEMNKYHADGGQANRARFEGRARGAGFRR